MMTVKEVSSLTGVSVRTLQYYDRIGLLHPKERTEAGYRLYDEAALGRLSEILLFRELEFPLKEIRQILDHPAYDKEQALKQQIALLELKKERLENLILFAREIQNSGGNTMHFEAFSTEKIDTYAKQAKEKWGSTPQYQEYLEKDRDRSETDKNALTTEMMNIFCSFGAIRDQAPESQDAQSLVEQLQQFISTHFYTCTDPVLKGLGRMYAAGGEMTENIDAAGGKGTAAFAAAAIERYHR